MRELCGFWIMTKWEPRYSTSTDSTGLAFTATVTAIHGNNRLGPFSLLILVTGAHFEH